MDDLIWILKIDVLKINFLDITQMSRNIIIW